MIGINVNRIVIVNLVVESDWFGKIDIKIFVNYLSE